MTTDRTRAAVVGLSLCIALFVSGCGEGDVETACLPDEAARVLHVAPLSTPANGPSRVEVLFDGSGSMAGYIRAATAEIRPVQDLVALLPGIASRRSDAVQFFKFGTQLHAVPTSDVERLAEAGAYACNGRPGCDNQESYLDLVLKHSAEGSPTTLTVIVTDLWLSNSKLAQSGEVAIGTQLQTLFDGGRSVSIIGIRAPYRGQVYDLPNGRSYSREDERPLFVLLIGPLELVESYRTELLNSESPAFAADRTHESLFTTEPFRGGSLTLKQATSRPTAALAPQPVLPIIPGISFQQFAVSNYAARIAHGHDAEARLVVPLAQRALPGAVWQGEFEPHAQVWMRQNTPSVRGKCTQWVKYTNLAQRWDLGRREFTLDARHDVANFAPKHTYMVATWLVPGSITTPNPANRWMRDWSFNVSNVDAVMGAAPTLFPTLNLELTAGVLEASLNKSLAQKPAVPLGVVTAVRLDD